MADPIEKDVRCRVCASDRISYLCCTLNEHSPSRDIFNYRCKTCGSVFVGNVIEEKELEIAYSTMNMERYSESIKNELQKKMRTAINHLKKNTLLDSKIIDIGTGNGLFVEMLCAQGFKNVSGHEIKGSDLSRVENLAQELYTDFNYETIPSETFDVVTLLDVMEHVLIPKKLAGTCARILKKDGMIYFHTPVVTKTDRFMHFLQKLPGLKNVGISWQRARTSIFHLEIYTPKSLRTLLKNAGFSDIKITVRNELSWPVSNYVKVYLLAKRGLSLFWAPLLIPFVYPFLKLRFFNANKAIVSAKKS